MQAQKEAFHCIVEIVKICHFIYDFPELHNTPGGFPRPARFRTPRDCGLSLGRLSSRTRALGQLTEIPL
jgi:hypothetical protein